MEVYVAELMHNPHCCHRATFFMCLLGNDRVDWEMKLTDIYRMGHPSHLIIKTLLCWSWFGEDLHGTTHTQKFPLIFFLKCMRHLGDMPNLKKHQVSPYRDFSSHSPLHHHQTVFTECQNRDSIFINSLIVARSLFGKLPSNELLEFSLS